MKSLMPLALIGLLSATLAGCIGADDVAPPLPRFPDVETIVELTHELEDGHTHADLHDVASPNVDLLSFHSLAGDGVAFVDGNAEVDYRDGYAYVATLGETSGFVIVDVSDLEAMEVVGRYSNANVYSPDVKVTWDSQYAILSSHPGTTLQTHAEPVGAVPSRVTDPLAYTDESHVTGVTLVDVSDKTNPVRVAEYIAEPNGVHNTEYANIDGRDIIFSVDRNKVTVLEIRDTPAGVELVEIAEILADNEWRDQLPAALGNTNPNAYLPAGSHDVVYQIHPDTGDHLVYIAFGRAGFYIYNVNDPTRPAMMSQWKDLPADSGYYHYAIPMSVKIDERHITIVAPEVFNAETSTGTMAILDTSNPRQPTQIGTWVLPGEDLFIEKNYRFSPHNMDVRDDGRVVLANYHAGVWVLDLACDDCLEMPQVDAFYLPHEETDRLVDDEPKCAFWCERPFVWGAVWGEGDTILASDVESGLYAISYAPFLRTDMGLVEDENGEITG